MCLHALERPESKIVSLSRLTQRANSPASFRSPTNQS
jgi:hypothetical protein